MRTLLKWNLWVCLLIVTAFTSCKDDNDDGNTEDPNYVFKVADEYKTLACSAKGKTFVIDVTSTKIIVRLVLKLSLVLNGHRQRLK